MTIRLAIAVMSLKMTLDSSTHPKWQLQISAIQFWLLQIIVADISNVIMTSPNCCARCCSCEASHWILAQQSIWTVLTEAMAVAVVDKIVRKCHEIERAYHQGVCGERELRSLESCDINLQRIVLWIVNPLYFSTTAPDVHGPQHYKPGQKRELRPQLLWHGGKTAAMRLQCHSMFE